MTFSSNALQQMDKYYGLQDNVIKNGLWVAYPYTMAWFSWEILYLVLGLFYMPCEFKHTARHECFGFFYST